MENYNNKDVFNIINEEINYILNKVFIRIEENENTCCKHIRFCSDNGDIYRDISVGPTPKGGDYADAYYLDENFKPTSRENAYWMDIHEMRLNGKMIGDVIGICERKYDAKKWMKREW